MCLHVCDIDWRVFHSLNFLQMDAALLDVEKKVETSVTLASGNAESWLGTSG